eukprot:3495160-Rhodomonas_salina.1
MPLAARSAMTLTGVEDGALWARFSSRALAVCWIWGSVREMKPPQPDAEDHQRSSAKVSGDKAIVLSQERQSQSLSPGRLQRLMFAYMLRVHMWAAEPKLQNCDMMTPARKERVRAEL